MRYTNIQQVHEKGKHKIWLKSQRPIFPDLDISHRLYKNLSLSLSHQSGKKCPEEKTCVEKRNYGILITKKSSRLVTEHDIVRGAEPSFNTIETLEVSEVYE